MRFGTNPAGWPLAMLLWLAALLWLGVLPAQAGEGHDHGDESAAAPGAASPRFAAVSETFELVGVLNGEHLTLYLDRFDDNSPVVDARIELEIANRKVPVEVHGEGEYEAMLPGIPPPGLLPVLATVHVGNESDLLAGELDLHTAATGKAEEHSHDWKEYALWAAAAAIALAILAWLTRKLRTSRSTTPAGVE